MRTLSASQRGEASFFDQPKTEQAKVVGLAAATVAVAAFWSLLLMAPDTASAPPPSAPIVQQAPTLDASSR